MESSASIGPVMPARDREDLLPGFLAGTFAHERP